MTLHRASLLLALSLLAASVARAEDATALRLDTKSFLFARWASRNASALYAGYGWGSAGVFFAMVENPRTGYREVIGGAMSRLARGGQSLTVGLAAADASDSDYLQLYLVPSLSHGAWSLEGTLETYEPLQSAGIRQLELNPLTLLRRVGRRAGVGASYVLSLAPGAAARHRGGPALRVEVPRGALQLELLAGLQNAKDELRIGFQASF